MSPELSLAIRLAREAGAIAMKHYEGVSVEFKPDDSPVTVADREAERHLRQELSKAHSSDGILGEELGELNAGAPRRWVIDPIDGTKSYVSGVPLFSTLMGMEEQGQPILGVAHFPAIDETYWAEKGEGAFLNGGRISVSGEADIARAFFAIGSLDSFRKTNRLDWLLALSERAYAMRTWGDAYGHCLVARGSVAAMLDPSVSVWDTCAVSIIVREAGGRFTDFAGIDSHTSGEAISAAPNMLAHLLNN